MAKQPNPVLAQDPRYPVFDGSSKTPKAIPELLWPKAPPPPKDQR